jgi:acyl-CoA thioester hydrolase
MPKAVMSNGWTRETKRQTMPLNGDVGAATKRLYVHAVRVIVIRRLTNAGFPNKLHRSMSRPVIEHQDVVRPEWIDSNGHMNLAYYVVVFDFATDALYRALNIGDAYREASGNSCFTAETHTLYEREVHLGDKLLIRTWLFGADTKRLHYFHEMFHADSGERSAVQELMALHIDMSVRRVAPYPPERYAALQRAVKEYAPATLPKGAGRRIALPGR